MEMEWSKPQGRKSNKQSGSTGSKEKYELNGSKQIYIAPK